MAERDKENAIMHNKTNASKNAENGSSASAALISDLMLKISILEAAQQKHREKIEKINQKLMGNS